MKVEIKLRFENDDPDNTWFSSNDQPELGDVQLFIPRELYIVLGRPVSLDVAFAPARSEVSG